MGRRSKLTSVVQELIVQAVRGGNTYDIAARCGGIDRTTFHRWKDRGERAKSGIYFAFHKAVEAARAEAVSRNVDIVQQAGAGVQKEKIVTRTFWEGSGKDARQVTETTVTKSVDRDWRAAAFWLERQQRRDFGSPHASTEEGNVPTGNAGDLARDIMQTLRDIDDATAAGSASARETEGQR